jgi:hypothetical protein
MQVGKYARGDIVVACSIKKYGVQTEVVAVRVVVKMVWMVEEGMKYGGERAKYRSIYRRFSQH